jgi:aspartate kinase
MTARTSELVVWKFGRGCLADLARVRAVARRLARARKSGRRVVAVLSAMGDSTDQLVRLAREISSRPPDRELDALLSTGGDVSCALTAMTLRALGQPAISLTGAQAGVITGGSHGDARPVEVRPQRVLEALDDDAIVLVAGSQGLSRGGDVTTLGRGGSDTSAVALAAGLGLHECELFTDVRGVLTANSPLIRDARLLPTLNHDEMLYLARAGAAAVQPRAVALAAEHDVDLRVRSSFTDAPGTWIRKEAAMLAELQLAAIAVRRHEPIFSVRGRSPAIVARALTRRRIAVRALVADAGVARFTAPCAQDAEVVAALDAIGADVVIRRGLGSVSVVGAGAGPVRARAALARDGIHAELVTSAHGRVSCHTASDAVHQAARALHDAFALPPHGDRVAA